MSYAAITGQTMDSPEFKFLDVNGLNVRYLQGGSGPSVVLLHGWGCRIETLRVIFDRLLPLYRVTALDLPGHGETELPPEPWGGAEFAEFLIRFLDKLRLGPSHLVGHSVGGRFAALIAAKEPERLEKLVLASASGLKPPRSLKYRAKVLLGKSGKFAARFFGEPGNRFKEFVYSRIASADYQDAGPLRSSFVKIVNEEIRAQLREIEVPTLLIWGQDDQETPLSVGKKMNLLIPNSELVVIANAGHYTFIDAAEKFMLYLQKFLRE